MIFRTSDGRGWGVKTLENIPKNQFVVEYIGEIIRSEEAERRGRKYDAAQQTYLFDLDYTDDNAAFTIDACRYGNVSHFINHSVSFLFYSRTSLNISFAVVSKFGCHNLLFFFFISLLIMLYFVA